MEEEEIESGREGGVEGIGEKMGYILYSRSKRIGEKKL